MLMAVQIQSVVSIAVAASDSAILGLEAVETTTNAPMKDSCTLAKEPIQTARVELTAFSVSILQEATTVAATRDGTMLEATRITIDLRRSLLPIAQIVTTGT